MKKIFMLQLVVMRKWDNLKKKPDATRRVNIGRSRPIGSGHGWAVRGVGGYQTYRGKAKVLFEKNDTLKERGLMRCGFSEASGLGGRRFFSEKIGKTGGKSPENHIRQYFKDDATAFNNEKSGKIVKKGIINNYLSERLMSHLASKGVRTHFVERITERQQLIRKLNMFPLEVVVRNIAAGSICKRLGLKEGKELPHAIVEYYYKNDDLGDPMVSENHIAAFKWASNQELKEIYTISLRVNDILRELFNNANIILVDFKLEYGKDGEGNIILADEISPDSCRLWDQTTLDKMDKDRFRHNLGGEAEAYAEVARRLGVYPPT